MPWADAIAKIKLPSGTAGKVCMMVITVAIAFAAIVIAVRNPWIALVALVLLSALALVLGLKVIDFADRHPDAAILEGKHLIDYAQVERAKYTESRIVEPSDKVEKRPIQLTQDERRLLAQPEEEGDG